MKALKDSPIVLTLDAGGTNFVFSAIQQDQIIGEPITLPSNGHDLDACIATMKSGFQNIISQCPQLPKAISFAFPGPADYRRGIIHDLHNLPSFRGGVPLKAILEEMFQLPTFINNDGSLFAMGEAIGGFLPWVNNSLRDAGSPRVYRNLVGVTLGTGFGGGMIIDGQMLIGDNSNAAEVWVMSNRIDTEVNLEQLLSIRALKRFYCEAAHIDRSQCPEPIDIYFIAKGEMSGHQNAANLAFKKYGHILGDALANMISMADGLVVIGGGLSGAWSLFLPHVIEEMRGTFKNYHGDPIRRTVAQIHNAEDEKDLASLVKGNIQSVKMPGMAHELSYDATPRICVGLSRLGTSKAVSIGAYAHAIKELNRMPYS